MVSRQLRSGAFGKIERITEFAIVHDGETYEVDCLIFATGFREAMWVTATLAAAGGVLSYLMIRDDPVVAAGPAYHLSCPLDAPPPRH